jgi:hypothetical protein
MNEDTAADLVNQGMYIEETKTETLEHIDSITASVTEIQPDSVGQLRT